MLSRGCYDGLTDAAWEDLNATAKRLQFKTFGDMHDCYQHTDAATNGYFNTSSYSYGDAVSNADSQAG